MSKLYCYESLTSDLKVWTERSPLSEWTDTNIVKKLRFQIIFNRNQAKSPVIRGNQTQLESLITGIASYVDRLLNSSSSNQDFEFQLFHQVDIPSLGKFSRLEFSTLELFDLFTNLELLTNEIEILPILVSNVYPINSLWLKVAVAAIASVGATVGITTGTLKLLQPESPQYVVTSNSIANSDSEQKSRKSNDSVNLSQPQVKPQAPQSLGKDKVQPAIPTDNLVQTPKSAVKAPQTLPNSPIPKPLKIDEQTSSNPLAITNPAIAQIPKILEQPSQVPATITDSSNLKTSGITGQSRQSTPIPSNSALDGANARQEIPKTELENTNIGRTTSKGLIETPLNSTRTRAMSKASERRDVDGFSGKISKNQAINQNSNENSDTSPRDQNLKITVIKIDGSLNPQDLEAYIIKIKSLSLSDAKLGILINTDIKIAVRWQNRQIIETKIIPESESPELLELIQRSLAEVITEKSEPVDGNLEMIVKLVKN